MTDADLAGDKPSMRSTTGSGGILRGPRTLALVFGLCKRQGQTSLSTPESELTALVVAGKRSFSHHMTLQRLAKRHVRLRILSDNSAARRVSATGVSAQMSYIKRTSNISMSWCRQNLKEFIGEIETDYNFSDIWTKGLSSSTFHRHRLAIGIGDLSEFEGNRDLLR